MPFLSLIKGFIPYVGHAFIKPGEQKIKSCATYVNDPTATDKSFGAENFKNVKLAENETNDSGF